VAARRLAALSSRSQPDQLRCSMAEALIGLRNGESPAESANVTPHHPSRSLLDRAGVRWPAEGRRQCSTSRGHSHRIRFAHRRRRSLVTRASATSGVPRPRSIDDRLHGVTAQLGVTHERVYEPVDSHARFRRTAVAVQFWRVRLGRCDSDYATFDWGVLPLLQKLDELDDEQEDMPRGPSRAWRDVGSMLLPSGSGGLPRAWYG
jgi:hypothetical protein